jgi:cytochrome c oxidase assembly protein subunit 15
VNLLVIVWGAYVRATGSGAGCGRHWPTCHGVVIPRAPSEKTLIELSHRLSSGLALVLTVALLVWSLKALEKGHPSRRAAGFSMAFILGEALLGAGLVLFELVAGNASVARAFAMSVHLVNTFLLLGAFALTVNGLFGGRPLGFRNQGPIAPLFSVAAAGMALLGVSGAIAALGDTLFPASSLVEGMRQDVQDGAHVFLRLRALHPLLAILEACLLFATAVASMRLRPSAQVRRRSMALIVLVCAQMVAGIVNLALLAPVGMQLLHLLLADGVWIAFVLLFASVFAEDASCLPSALGPPARPVPNLEPAARP